MAERPINITDAEFDRLLRDCGEHLQYPPVPDVSPAIRSRLVATPEAASADVPRDAGAWGESPPSPGRETPMPVDEFGLPSQSGRRTWFGQFVRLAAAILVFSAVSALLVVIFRGFGADGPSTGGGEDDAVELSYIGLRGESPHLYAVDVESGEERDLTGDSLMGDRAAWSPDGEQLAVSLLVEDSGDQRLRIFLMKADGSGLRPLTDLPGAQMSPTWSSDGEMIAFISPGETGDELAAGVSEIYVTRVDTGETFNVSNLNQMSLNPIWSPDGKWIAFVSMPAPDALTSTAPTSVEQSIPGDSSGAMYIVNWDGSSQTVLAKDSIVTIAGWSPDGEWIRYQTSQSDPGWMSVDLTGNIQPLLPELDGPVSSPDWSPDGASVVFERFGGIWVANADGSDLHILAEHGGFPVWSPDGEWIAFISDEGGAPEIAIVRPDGSDLQVVTNHEDPLDVIANLTWRPDGQSRTVEPVESRTPTPEEQMTTLFAVDFDGTITAMDAETMETRYTVEVGSNADAVVASDGRRLYAAGLTELLAFDAATGEELWRAQVENRTDWILGIGPSVLAVSPDGERLYVYSHAGQYSHWLQIFDAKTGEKVGETDRVEAQCPAPPVVSASGETAYLPCQRSALVNAFDLTAPSGDQHFTVSAPVPTGSAQSPDGQHLYLVSQSGLLTIIEGDARDVSEPVDLLEENLTIPRGLVALSVNERYLFVGIRTEMRDVSGEVRVYDTETLEEVARLMREPAMTGWTLAGGEDAVFGVEHRYVEGTGIPAASEIVRLGIDGEVETRVLAGQEIMRLLVASVPLEN